MLNCSNMNNDGVHGQLFIRIKTSYPVLGNGNRLAGLLGVWKTGKCLLITKTEPAPMSKASRGN
jgi:hypothetical protein